MAEEKHECWTARKWRREFGLRRVQKEHIETTRWKKEVFAEIKVQKKIRWRHNEQKDRWS